MENLSYLNGAVMFETERMICRRWLPTDVDMIFSVYSDPVGARWVDDSSPITRDQCEDWLQVTANNYAMRGYGMFALVDRTSKEALGFCGLIHPGGQIDAEIKYAFSRPQWGQGLASEAVPGMIAYGTRNHLLAKIIATVAPENVASQRVLLKTGFTFVEEKADDDGDLTRFYEWHAEVDS